MSHNFSDLPGVPLTDTAANVYSGPIDLSTPLSLATSFRFPLQSTASRREVWIGAALLLLPGVGWLLNMGHRVMMVHRMLHGQSAWPSWTDPLTLLLWAGGLFAATFGSYLLGYRQGRKGAQA